MVNNFTPTWFTTYLKTYDEAITTSELAFITRQLPLPACRRLLDLCCGNGRHAIPLGACGYDVMGLDFDVSMLAEARILANGKAQFIEGDMRSLDAIPNSFDAVINMWHSFGYFDAATNTAVLRQVYNKLNPPGRFILDIYNRQWFMQHQGTEITERDGRHFTTTRFMNANRLTVQIDYADDLPADIFDWHLYTPTEMCALAEQIGFRTLVQCTWADESRPITPDDARMQFVFEKA